jgi:hypothetical protein
MRRDLIIEKSLHSSFYSSEKDAEIIIQRLFTQGGIYSDQLKRLLVLNTKDCLDNSNENYRKIMANTSVKDIMEGNYFTLVPKIKMKEHEEVKSYVILTFDNFVETSNPEFRDCTVSFDILCHTDYWDLGDYKMRPMKIAGIIDGLLNDTKLTGIGRLHFLGMSQLILNEELSGYSLLFQATHGSDDRIPGEE